VSLAPLDLVSADVWHRVTFTTYALSLSFFEVIVLDRLIRGGGRQAMILADVEGVRASLSEQGAQRVGKDYEVEPVAVTSGVFHPKVSVFSGPEASGKPTAIEPEFEFRRGRYRDQAEGLCCQEFRGLELITERYGSIFTCHRPFHRSWNCGFSVNFHLPQCD
jgi:hypothetical protein